VVVVGVVTLFALTMTTTTTAVVVAAAPPSDVHYQWVHPQALS